MVVEAASAGRVTATWALSIREKLQVPVGWCSSGLSAKEYEYTPGYGQPEWWLYAWTWLKYLPFWALNRSCPLRTSLKSVSGPTSSSVNLTREPASPTLTSGTPDTAVVDTKQLPEASEVASESMTMSDAPGVVVKFHKEVAVFADAGSLKHQTNSLTGWL